MERKYTGPKYYKALITLALCWDPVRECQRPFKKRPIDGIMELLLAENKAQADELADALKALNDERK